MKKLYNFLNTAIWCCFGIFLGSSAYQWFHYRAHPDLYAIQSAPWYLSIQIRAVSTAIVVSVLLLARWAVRRRMSRQ